MASAFLLLFLATSTKAQDAANTVGVMLQSEASYDGFTLLPVTSSNSTFLINNCGEEVKCWTSNYKAGGLDGARGANEILDKLKGA